MVQWRTTHKCPLTSPPPITYFVLYIMTEPHKSCFILITVCTSPWYDMSKLWSKLMLKQCVHWSVFISYLYHRGLCVVMSTVHGMTVNYSPVIDWCENHMVYQTPHYCQCGVPLFYGLCTSLVWGFFFCLLLVTLFVCVGRRKYPVLTQYRS